MNKIDLIPYTDFDIETLEETIRKMNPSIEIFRVSCTMRDGLEKWTDWLKDKVRLGSG